ncbi:uncharacterized [Tachysurus ichikawai]
MRIGNQGYPRSFCSRTTPSKILPTFQHIPLCQLQPQWNHKPCISGLQGSANPSYSIMVLKVRSRETQGILIDRSRFDWAATELCNGCTKPRSGRIDREELRQPVVHSISPPFIFRMAAISVRNLFPVQLNKISRNTGATRTSLRYNLVQDAVFVLAACTRPWVGSTMHGLSAQVHGTPLFPHHRAHDEITEHWGSMAL